MLAACSPPLVAPGHRGDDGRFDGLLLQFARRLRVSAGRRTRTAAEKASGADGRPRAFLQAAMTRAACDKAALMRGEFALGDSVLARGQPGTLVGIHGDGSCTVEFKAGAAYEQVTYSSMRGTPRAAPEAGAEGPVRPARTNAAGSARLQHVPITLEPEARKQSSQATSNETEALIYEHYLTSLARSPHQRDAMSRRVARHVWEKEQALILTETCAALVRVRVRIRGCLQGVIAPPPHPPPLLWTRLGMRKYTPATSFPFPRRVHILPHSPPSHSLPRGSSHAHTNGLKRLPCLRQA